MKTYIIGCVSVAVMAAIVWLDTQHVLDFIRSQPTCFPPYILMKDEGSVSHETYRSCSRSADDGLRTRAVDETVKRTQQWEYP